MKVVGRLKPIGLVFFIGPTSRDWPNWWPNDGCQAPAPAGLDVRHFLAEMTTTRRNREAGKSSGSAGLLPFLLPTPDSSSSFSASFLCSFLFLARALLSCIFSLPRPSWPTLSYLFHFSTLFSVCCFPHHILRLFLLIFPHSLEHTTICLSQARLLFAPFF